MRKDATQNHQKILAAATDLFQKDGVAAVSMKDIATAAHLGPGTLYRNYPNKGTLCLDLVYNNLQKFIATHRALTPTAANWHLLLSNYLIFREANSALLATIESDSQVNFTQTELYHQLSRLFFPFLQAVLPSATAATIQFRTDMLIAMLKSDSYAFQRQERHLSNKQLCQLINELLLSPLLS
ncbi:TetR/AcrR family transcriptional regulator [Levilactobacillus enshiensis]|uniref:TetR/AcrR family transcriptional regulator n=1 Tax=Levilactobacillus enshiensis TaxID=2590213 RepID=UPI00117AB270|nr:TetR/AcrR family transcriptional regulator [Levilactobacillus enshiensis]